MTLVFFRKNEFVRNLGESNESETCQDVNITLPEGLNNVGEGPGQKEVSCSTQKPSRQLSEPCKQLRNNNQKVAATLSARPRLITTDTFETSPVSPLKTIEYSRQISHSRTSQLSPCMEQQKPQEHSQDDFFSNIDISGIATQTSDFIGGLLGENCLNFLTTEL